MEKRKYRIEKFTMIGRFGKPITREIKLADNEKFIRAEANGRLVKERDGHLMFRDDHTIHWTYMYYVPKRYAHNIPNLTYYNDIIKCKKDLMVQNVINEIEIKKQGKSHSYLDFKIIDKKIENEFLLQKDMTDLDVFMFVYFEIYNKNYQATVNYLLGHRFWNIQDVISTIRSFEKKYYMNTLKLFKTPKMISIVRQIYEETKNNGITFQEFYSMITNEMNNKNIVYAKSTYTLKMNNDLKKTKSYYYFMENDYHNYSKNKISLSSGSNCQYLVDDLYR